MFPFYKIFCCFGARLLLTFAVAFSILILPAQPAHSRSNSKKVLGIGLAIGAAALIFDAQKKVKSKHIRARPKASGESQDSAKSKEETSSEIPEFDTDPILLQTALAEKGYYKGHIDGKQGPGTRKALATYQRDNGYEPTGILTAVQAELLLGTDGGIPEDLSAEPQVPGSEALESAFEAKEFSDTRQR